MKVRYNRIIGIIFLSLGLMTCCVAAVFSRTNEALPSGLAAGFWVTFIAGILFLTGTYIEVTHNELIIRSLIGFVSKRISLSSSKELSVEDGRIFLVKDGLHQNLGVSSWVADKRSWNVLINWIKTGVISAV